MNYYNYENETWFEKLFGFKEINHEQVQSKFRLAGDKITSLANNRTFQFGELEVISLKDLRSRTVEITSPNKSLKIDEIVGDVQKLHSNSENNNAIFQAASQFNLLEMVGPQISPEEGIGIYERDFTQGPACAIACGAGTLYRNYFAEVNNQLGQTETHQINCLSEIEKALDNENLDLWRYKNGYALANESGLGYLSIELNNLSAAVRDNLLAKLKVGIQWDTEVTLPETKNIVTQIYCSALPVAYSNILAHKWEPFARLVLEATYEATLHAALINLQRNGSNKVFLTLVGGGAFGNDEAWIKDAILKSLTLFKNTPLDVKIVSYGESKEIAQSIISEFNN